MKRIWPYTVIALLLVTNLITAGFLARHVWHNRLWEQQMYAQATYGGTLKAIADFRAGELRIYRVVSGGRIEFTGQMDGEFEVWTWPSPGEGFAPFAYTAETFVKAYNSRMRNMVAQPDHFDVDHDARRKLSGSGNAEDRE